MSDGLHLLDGIRVVSLEQFIAAPYCTQMLADAGAEVIKVERPGTGDPRRWYDPKVGPDDDYISGGFASYNRGKKSVELDLSAYDGWQPIEMIGETAFPLIGELPYFVTLGPHSFYWFRLVRPEA